MIDFWNYKKLQHTPSWDIHKFGVHSWYVQLFGSLFVGMFPAWCCNVLPIISVPTGGENQKAGIGLCVCRFPINLSCQTTTQTWHQVLALLEAPRIAVRVMFFDFSSATPSSHLYCSKGWEEQKWMNIWLHGSNYFKRQATECEAAWPCVPDGCVQHRSTAVYNALTFPLYSGILLTTPAVVTSRSSQMTQLLSGVWLKGMISNLGWP